MDINKNTVQKEARNWLIILNSGEVSVDIHKKFEHWYASSAENSEAFNTVEKTWDMIPLLTELAELESLDEPSFLKNSLARIKDFFSQPYRPAFASASAMLIIIFIAISQYDMAIPPPPYETQTAQTKDILLADGSEINIGALSAIKVNYNENSRHVTLASGEAFFSITPDRERPFFVSVGNVMIRVVGTKFNVRQGSEEISISVVEGVVEILPLAAPDTSNSLSSIQRITAGEAIVADASGTFHIQKHNKETTGSWRNGRLVYVDKRLIEVIADANRYYDKRIELANKDIANIRITAAFRTDQIDVMIENLIAAHPLQVIQKGNKRIIVRKNSEK